MRAGREAVNAGGLVSLQEQFKRWRSQRAPRSRIPMELWEGAVQAAREYGIYKVSRAVGLGYRELKEQVLKSGGQAVVVRPEEPTFVEVKGVQVMASGMMAGGTQIEVSAPDGAKLRVVLGAGEAVEWGVVMGSFWRRGA